MGQATFSEAETTFKHHKVGHRHESESAGEDIKTMRLR